MSHQPRGRRAERRGLRLLHIGIVLPLVFTVAVLIAGFVFYTGWDLLGARGLKKQQKIDSATLFDLVKLSFGVVAGAGGLVALVVAYRRQRVDEDAALRDTTRLHNERFTTAVSQLGNTSPTVRLGGVHALAGLADDAPTRELRQTCIDVLCAFLRLPYTAESDLPPSDSAARHDYLALREARHTVIRLIRDHLRLPQKDPRSWQGHDFDFTSTVFDGGDLSEANFSGGVVTFAEATFSGAGVNFGWTEFSGGIVDFVHAEFSGGIVNFFDAKFSGGIVNFSRAMFSGSTVGFSRATFSGGRVDFFSAVFSESAVDLRKAKFSGGSVDMSAVTLSGGTIDFTRAQFTGATVDFVSGCFSDGDISFHHAAFAGGRVNFSNTEFSGGRVNFSNTEFSGGTTVFTMAEFSGATVFFAMARFSEGVVDFGHAVFSGGTLTYLGASGSAPRGLLASLGTPVPAGVTLAEGW
ncbi:pentapeptide repeat-containing protein [Streptomyces halstedii]|uniref:pentapeptide repeat-containing protein n=1 Tax=Streptomyces halstedii TaxID=1944 RepID=UPI003697904A